MFSHYARPVLVFLATRVVSLGKYSDAIGVLNIHLQSTVFVVVYVHCSKSSPNIEVLTYLFKETSNVPMLATKLSKYHI